MLSNENDARLINVTNNDAKIAPVSLGHFHVNISSTKIKKNVNVQKFLIKK
jgi:hypothetical protein